MSKNKKEILVKLLRWLRRLHRRIASILFFFFFIVSITGFLLGIKKHTGGVILPITQNGTTDDLSKWLSIDSLHTIALKTLVDSLSPNLSPELERIDLRKQKGVAKFVFIDNYVGIQVDGATGKVLQIETRRSDFIENIHDGSILDYLFKTDNEQVKLIYTLIMSMSLLFLTFSGFWLWYGPIIIKRFKKSTDK
ncbi:MAG: PepSY domain-containing protein [Fimbriimonadaceae bacterium]|nr:PepSY domain-containing protein [Chitinophagales bacterium]